MKSPALVIGTLLILVLVVGTYFYFTRSGSATFACSTLPAPPSILAFGDSLTAGYGAPAGQGYVDDLSKSLGVPIANYGVSGDTSAQALARIDAALTQKPDIILVLLGGNDALQKIPQTETQTNLDTIVTKFQARGATVVLLGVLGGFPQDPYASMFSALAKTHHVTYVPNVLSGLIGNSALMYDQVHPNAAGYQKLAARLLPTLEQTCKTWSLKQY